LKEEALDRSIWRNHFGRDFGSVIRQNTEWILYNITVVNLRPQISNCNCK
jgi:hypothetical protein